MQREGTVGPNGSRVKSAFFTIFTPIMGDRMEAGCWIVPGDGRAHSNAYYFGGVVG